MTWLIKLAVFWSWPSYFMKRLRVGVVSFHFAAERTTKRVAELVASFERIDFFCALQSAVLMNRAVKAVSFWTSNGSRASVEFSTCLPIPVVGGVGAGMQPSISSRTLSFGVEDLHVWRVGQGHIVTIAVGNCP
jgi:hypothetical protein